jgi:hypothetical protein
VSGGALGCGSCDRPTTSQTVNCPLDRARHLLPRPRPFSRESRAHQTPRLRMCEAAPVASLQIEVPYPPAAGLRARPLHASTRDANPRPLTPSFSSLTTNAVTHRDIASRFPITAVAATASLLATCHYSLRVCGLSKPSPVATSVATCDFPRLTPSPPPQA